MKPMTVQYFTTPKGDEMAVLPRAELEALREAAEHAQAVADYQAGRLPGLTPEQAREFVASNSPLAFWRKHKGMTQAMLAAEVGIAQNYLSDIENAKRSGPVELWLRLSDKLGVPVEALVEAE
jgi:DNA-binding XRE family transcriptional regulator